MTTPEYNLAPIFRANDGTEFATKQAAVDYMRKPLIKEALLAVAGLSSDIADMIIANTETVEIAFESGTIRRVTKAEHGKLAKALEFCVASETKELAFLAEVAEDIKSSFKYAPVKRMSDDEKVAAAKNSLAAVFDTEVAAFIIENKSVVIEALKAGIVKREVSDTASTALAKYRAEQAEKKEVKRSELAAKRAAAPAGTKFVKSDFVDEAEFKAYKAEIVVEAGEDY